MYYYSPPIVSLLDNKTKIYAMIVNSDDADVLAAVKQCATAVYS